MKRPNRTAVDPWTHGETDTIGVYATRMDLSGFSVEATDGSIGKVAEATYEPGSSFIVVDTGPWIFGRKVLLPAAVVERIDLDLETIFVNRTKAEIKNSPEFDDATYRDDAYRSQVSDYYSRNATTR